MTFWICKARALCQELGFTQIVLGPISTIRFLSHARGLRQAYDMTYDYKERLRLHKRWPCSTYVLNRVR